MSDLGYPFSALVGQEDLKLALTLLAVNPALGGVLLKGGKGTAKSTAARALSGVMPEAEPFEGSLGCSSGNILSGRDCFNGKITNADVFSPAKLVTLPLGASEEMILGGLDLSRFLADGAVELKPGLLSKADKGLLYVDEVNLLPEHLAVLILDAAASGCCRLEREGLSIIYPCRLCLLGSMNPEEGELGPQFMDRFGLCVDVRALDDPLERAEILKRRLDYESAPDSFCGRFAEAQKALRREIHEARRLLSRVRLDQGAKVLIPELAVKRNAEGHRAEICLAKAALAHAALRGRLSAGNRDVLAVAEFVLAHRAREARREERESQGPQNHRQSGNLKGQNAAQDSGKDQDCSPRDDSSGQDGVQSEQSLGEHPEALRQEKPEGDAKDKHVEAWECFSPLPISLSPDRRTREASGKRYFSRAAKARGRGIGSLASREACGICLVETLRAAAPHQASRKKPAGLAVALLPQDYRRKLRLHKTAGLVLFLVDASGSMGARGRMAASKGAILSLLLDAYQKRDRVALICFKRSEASLALAPTNSVETASRLLKELPVGGRTPLSAGLAAAQELLAREMRKDPKLRPLVLLITDAKATSAMCPGADPLSEALSLASQLGQDERQSWVVVDSEEPQGFRLNLSLRLAEALKARHFSLGSISSDSLNQIVKEFKE